MPGLSGLELLAYTSNETKALPYLTLTRLPTLPILFFFTRPSLTSKVASAQRRALFFFNFLSLSLSPSSLQTPDSH